MVCGSLPYNLIDLCNLTGYVYLYLHVTEKVLKALVESRDVDGLRQEVKVSQEH